jgi:hypothetical protein
VTRYTHSQDVLYENGTTIFEENTEVQGKVAELRGLVEKVIKKVWRRASV